MKNLKILSKKIVIADAGPLIALAKIDLLGLLQTLFSQVIISFDVYQECTQDLLLSGAKLIKQAVKDKLISVKKIKLAEEFFVLKTLLGQGEISAIALAKKMNALLLIDEKLGRKIARKKDLAIVGTSGLLLLAKQKKLIKHVKPLIKQLRDNGYFISPALVAAVLKKAGEK